jgi:hypothetical protein
MASQNIENLQKQLEELNTANVKLRRKITCIEEQLRNAQVGKHLKECLYEKRNEGDAPRTRGNLGNNRFVTKNRGGFSHPPVHYGRGDRFVSKHRGGLPVFLGHYGRGYCKRTNFLFTQFILSPRRYNPSLVPPFSKVRSFNNFNARSKESRPWYSADNFHYTSATLHPSSLSNTGLVGENEKDEFKSQDENYAPSEESIPNHQKNAEQEARSTGAEPYWAYRSSRAPNRRTLNLSVSGDNPSDVPSPTIKENTEKKQEDYDGNLVENIIHEAYTQSLKELRDGYTDHRRRAVLDVPLKPSTEPTHLKSFNDGGYDDDGLLKKTEEDKESEDDENYVFGRKNFEPPPLEGFSRDEQTKKTPETLCPEPSQLNFSVDGFIPSEPVRETNQLHLSSEQSFEPFYPPGIANFSKVPENKNKMKTDSLSLFPEPSQLEHYIPPSSYPPPPSYGDPYTCSVPFFSQSFINTPQNFSGPNCQQSPQVLFSYLPFRYPPFVPPYRGVGSPLQTPFPGQTFFGGMGVPSSNFTSPTSNFTSPINFNNNVFLLGSSLSVTSAKHNSLGLPKSIPFPLIKHVKTDFNAGQSFVSQQSQKTEKPGFDEERNDRAPKPTSLSLKVIAVEDQTPPNDNSQRGCAIDKKSSNANLSENKEKKSSSDKEELAVGDEEDETSEESEESNK